MGFKNHVRHRGFVVEAYYENSRSVIATQRAFRSRFALCRNASVPIGKRFCYGFLAFGQLDPH